MRWLSQSITKVLKHIALTAGGGSAGLLGGYALAHKASIAIGTALALAAALSLAQIVESIYKRRPAILTAKSEAEALRKRTEVQADLLRAGLEPGKAELAREMLRQQALNPDLPKGRRLNDDVLAKLLAPSKVRSVDNKPDSRPPSTGSGPGNGDPPSTDTSPGSDTGPDSGPKGVVRPIR